MASGNTSSTKESGNLSSFIWKIANDLWGDFKHTDFARIIVPLLLLRRLECVLEPSKDAVLKAYNEEKNSGIDLSLILPIHSKLPFYNTSTYSLDTLGGTNTLDNLEEYISQFSANVRIIFEEFGFIHTIDELNKARLLYRMCSHFAAINLHPDAISERVMSNAYEELIRKFAASINEKAGEFMTPKDVVHLATSLVLSPDEAIFNEPGVIHSVYDPACGLLGFVTDAIDQIHSFNADATIVPFGQELDPKTHSMALTASLIRGHPAENIKQGSTLSTTNCVIKNSTTSLLIRPSASSGTKIKAPLQPNTKRWTTPDASAPACPVSAMAPCCFC